MSQRSARPRETKLHHALITMFFMVGIMFCGIVVLDAKPQIPLILGCLAAGIMAFHIGYSWEDILEGTVSSISESIEAILILTLIGMLVGSWIACGAVPTLIYYGLKIVSPSVFLPVTMLICFGVAFAIGSWGTVGTIGLAFVGIGLAMEVPLPIVVGAVISGSYMGEVVSPLSDATNLTAAVVKVNVFKITKTMIPVSAVCMAICLFLYGLMGYKFSANSGDGIESNLEPLLKNMAESFNISPITLIPLVIVIGCIVTKIPAIPAMLAGALSGMIEGILVQGVELKDVIEYGYSGYVSKSGYEILDSLLSTGGIMEMLEPISIIIIAMSFGGIMKKSCQMEALVSPIIKRINSLGLLGTLASVTCVIVNVIIPDQYLSISIPGQMYSKEYDRKGFDRSMLSLGLLGGGAVTSPLVPWNTCGIYCAAVLGCSPLVYGPYSFVCLLLPLIVVVFFLMPRKRLA